MVHILVLKWVSDSFMSLLCIILHILLRCNILPIGRVFVLILIPLGISFLFSPLVVVVDTVAVSTQDYALFNLFVGFGKPPVL